MDRSTETLTIIFSWDPAAKLLRATLPNGAAFWVAPHEAHGKLGENLSLFRRAVEPRSSDFNIKVVAPGTAGGVTPLRDKEKTKAEQRKLQDEIDKLEITL